MQHSGCSLRYMGLVFGRDQCWHWTCGTVKAARRFALAIIDIHA
jgi:hypothetical protein